MVPDVQHQLSGTTPNGQSSLALTDDGAEERHRRRLTGILAVAAVMCVAAIVALAVSLHRPPPQVAKAIQRPSKMQDDAEAPPPVRPVPAPAAAPRPQPQTVPVAQPESPDPPARPPDRPPAPPPAVKVEPLKYPPLAPGRPVYGEYYLNTIQGFSVYINRTAFEESARAEGQPLDCLQDELDRVCRVSPTPRFLKAMRTIHIFVEWDHVEPGYPNSVAVFYGGNGEGQYLLHRGVAPQKAGHITILSLKRVTEEKLRHGVKRIVILHELAHAYHHYDLGDNNPFIQNAYDQARTRGLYTSVPDERRGAVRAYAATNAHEYFAELSCAYLDRCGYFPHDRDSLREYDSVGYELMRKVWGDLK
jgi:hypothetical protein